MEYIQQNAVATSCVFCDLPACGDDASAFILHRAQLNYIVMNIYPYTTGHLLVTPFEHTADFASAAKAVTDEMMDLAKRCQAALAAVYRPEGFNVGMNLGRAAGAGIAEHFHLHVLPRWAGDTNFTTTVGEIRILPEDLRSTYNKLKPWFEEA